MKLSKHASFSNIYVVYQYYLDRYNFYYLRHDETYLEFWIEHYNNCIKKDIPDLVDFFRKEYKENQTIKMVRTTP